MPLRKTLLVRSAVPAGLLAGLLAGCSGAGDTGAAASSGAAAAATPGTATPVPVPAAPAGVTTPGSAPPGSTTAPAPATPAASGGDGLFARLPDVVRQVEPSVATIFTDGGLGSGVVYREDGYVVTNEHVVRGARQVQVAFADGRRVTGRVLAADRATDLAVVVAERQGLPAARFQPALPRVGELAVAIGSPLGLQNTTTAGIISGLHREIPGAAAQEGPTTALVDLLQTDAAISPGNSGGALVNANGEVIGINVAYLPPQAGAVSLGFAIPAATMQDVVQQLIDTGRAQHAFLGIQPATLTPEIAAQLGLTDAQGVVVLEVVTGGPAARAQLRPGDVITQFGEAPVRTVEEFLGELRRVRPGATVTLQVLRDGQQQPVQVTVGDRPQAEPTALPTSAPTSG